MHCKGIRISNPPKKYNASDSNDLSLITDYSTYIPANYYTVTIHDWHSTECN